MGVPNTPQTAPALSPHVQDLPDQGYPPIGGPDSPAALAAAPAFAAHPTNSAAAPLEDLRHTRGIRGLTHQQYVADNGLWIVEGETVTPIHPGETFDGARVHPVELAVWLAAKDAHVAPQAEQPPKEEPKP